MTDINFSHLEKTMIQDIDLALNNINEDLINYAKSVEFIEICTFELNENLGKLCESNFNDKGIYKFEIFVDDISIPVEGWMDLFVNDWINPDVIWVPGTKKNRIAQHKILDKWMPIYIGKSRKVGHRTNQHVHQKIDQHTFGMKLMGRTNLYGRTFRISWIPLNVNHYNLIAPTLESLLRERFHPITGKQ
jgi:hypothetical protein